MKKNLRYLLALCLSVMVVLTFAACGSDNTDEQSQSGQQQQQTTENKTEEQAKQKIDYSQYIGKYEDQKSHRALMEIKENTSGEGILIHIHWGSSSVENTEWDMTGTLENNMIIYKDCVKKHHVYDQETGELITDEVVKIDPTGFFEINNGALKWTGSPEEDCQLCVFEKVQK